MAKKGKGPALTIAAFLLLGGIGYATGYYVSADRASSSVATVASVQSSAVRPALATTSLPDQRVNAFAGEVLKLVGIDGEEHALTEWRGRVVMLNFWATWCPPCQYEIPDFIRYQQQYEAAGLQIVGVGIDEERKLKNFARTMELNYPVLVSPAEKSEALLNQWGNSQQLLPYTVIIDRDGRITYIQRGEFSQAAFDSFVLPLLSQNSAAN